MTEPEAETTVPDRVAISLEVAGIRLHFEGSRSFYEECLRETLAPLAEGRWREGPVPVSPVAAVAAAVAAGDAEAAALQPDASVVAELAPPAPPPPPPMVERRQAAAPQWSPLSLPVPPPVPARPAARASYPAADAPTIDSRALYGRLANEEARRAERDAVLLALVSLAIAGRRDATPSDVLDHMEENGYPVDGVKAKPVLAKLCHRRGLAVPGLLPNTFRATPAGAAHIFRLSKE